MNQPKERKGFEDMRERKKEKGEERKRWSDGSLGGEEEEEGSDSLATFRFALIKATWSSPQNT